MNRRWNALIAATLLLATASAALAQDADTLANDPAASTAAGDAATTDASGNDAAPATDASRPDRALFLRVAPHEKRVHPGSVAVFEILVKSHAEQEVRLSLDARADDAISYAIEPDHVKAGPEGARATLTVKVGDATALHYAMMLVAEGADGSKARHGLAIHVVRPCATAAGANAFDCKPNDKPQATYGIHIDPPMKRAKPGELVEYGIIVKSRSAQTIHLDLREATRGYEGRIEPATLTLDENGVARATLYAKSSADAAPGKGMFVVAAKSDDGEARLARAALQLVRDEPKPTPGPDVCRVHVVLEFDGVRWRALLADDSGRPSDGDVNLALMRAMNGCVSAGRIP